MLFVNLIEILEIIKEFFLLKIIWNIIRNLLKNLGRKYCFMECCSKFINFI
jgi:hypothetical protein